MAESSIRPRNIDLGSLILRSEASLYSNLVTRPTGRAVRGAIEEQLVEGGISVSVIDFTEVRVLDFSCADEVVAKLVQRFLGADRPSEAFFLFRTTWEHHHAVQEVLVRQQLAAVVDLGNGGFELLGVVSASERRAWRTLEAQGRIPSPHDADLDDEDDPVEVFTSLTERRLVFKDRSGEFVALSSLTRPE